MQAEILLISCISTIKIIFCFALTWTLGNTVQKQEKITVLQHHDIVQGIPWRARTSRFTGSVCEEVHSSCVEYVPSALCAALASAVSSNAGTRFLRHYYSHLFLRQSELKDIHLQSWEFFLIFAHPSPHRFNPYFLAPETVSWNRSCISQSDPLILSMRWSLESAQEMCI